MNNTVDKKTVDPCKFETAMRYRIHNIYSVNSKNGIKKDWQSASLVLDTNSILDLYRYSKKASDTALKSITSFSGKGWMPYQVFKELKRHLDKTIRKSDDSVNSTKLTVSQSITKTVKNITDSITKNQKNFPEKFHNKINEIMDEAKKKIFDSLHEELRGYHSSTDVDPILSKLKEKIETYGPETGNDEIEKWIKEAKERFTNKIPPGFSDEKNKMEEDRKYADYFIWKELILYAKSEKRPIVFITGDFKEDWWILSNKESGEKIVKPRYELQEEFFDKVEKEIYIVSLKQFIELSQKLSPNSGLEESEVDRAVEEIDTINAMDRASEEPPELDDRLKSTKQKINNDDRKSTKPEPDDDVKSTKPEPDSDNLKSTKLGLDDDAKFTELDDPN